MPGLKNMSPTSNDTDETSEHRVRAATLALAAISWVLQDGDRADRYLSLTGLDPDALRNGLGDDLILASVLEFLANHEPDLIRASEALAVAPEELISARKALTA